MSNPTLGDRIKAAGKSVASVPANELAATLVSQLGELLPQPYRVETGSILDSDGRRSAPFAALVCTGGQSLAAGSATPDIPAETVAAAIDVTHTLDVAGLAAAFERVAIAKSLRKATPAPGLANVEPTLGIIFATDATVSLEELANELERLNALTPSDHWADLVVVANKGQVSYSAQMLGSSKIDGILLPASPTEKIGPVFAFYAVMLLSATGAETFNLMMHVLSGQLARWSPGFALPGLETILDGISRQGITSTGYQYDLARQLRPVPSDDYQGRKLPPKSVNLYARGTKEQLGAMAFLKWQDGGVVVLKGKLPLGGLLIFLGGIVDADTLRKVQTMQTDGLQSSTVLPIGEAQYRAFLRNLQGRGGLDVRADEGKFVIQKFADEGSSTPFMARVFFAPLKLADALDGDTEPFKEAHQLLITTLMEIRDAAKDIARTWRDYNRLVETGTAVVRVGNHTQVKESVDRPLGRLVSDFLTGATRSFKERMQRTTRTLGTEIGFLYQKESTFDRELAELEEAAPALAAYLREARIWGDKLVNKRNNLDHGDWKLPRVIIDEVAGRFVATEPAIDGVPVTKWIADMTDRILCFAEDVLIHAIGKRLPQGITLTEIPIDQRAPEMPLRFQLTVAVGGGPHWEIRYHDSALDLT